MRICTKKHSVTTYIYIPTHNKHDLNVFNETNLIMNVLTNYYYYQKKIMKKNKLKI